MAHSRHLGPVVTSFDRHRPHPWHGLTPGPATPDTVDAYIEITPRDTLKYELDKQSGYLRLDRPLGAALPPAAYGFIPQTLCGDAVAALTPAATNGDDDPLDICVLSHDGIDRGDIIVTARVVGGLQVIDNDEADDKIVAVAATDPAFTPVTTLSDLAPGIVDRLAHYFATYKLDTHAPSDNPITVAGTYDREHATDVIRAAIGDYANRFTPTPNKGNNVHEH